jgi:hypothetical protein
MVLQSSPYRGKWTSKPIRFWFFPHEIVGTSVTRASVLPKQVAICNHSMKWLPRTWSVWRCLAGLVGLLGPFCGCIQTLGHWVSLGDNFQGVLVWSINIVFSYCHGALISIFLDVCDVFFGSEVGNSIMFLAQTFDAMLHIMYLMVRWTFLWSCVIYTACWAIFFTKTLLWTVVFHFVQVFLYQILFKLHYDICSLIWKNTRSGLLGLPCGRGP